MGYISIGCDRFNSRYHPTHVCLGLPDGIISTIKGYGGRSISFYCTSCRLEGGIGCIGPQSGSIVDGSRGLDDGFSEQAVKQLFETVPTVYVLHWLL